MKDIAQVLKGHCYPINSSDKYGQNGRIVRMLGIPENPNSKVQAPILVSSSWCSGGLTGGNCWGDKADRPVYADEEPEFEELLTFLEENFPEVSFLKYRKLLKCVKTEEFTDSGYYGNYSEYRFKYILHEDLLKILKED